MEIGEIANLGAVAVVFLFSIREFFAYLKSRREGAPQSAVMRQVLDELRAMNTNHLHDLKDAITNGNGRIVDAINHSSAKQIELLGEIKGMLDK